MILTKPSATPEIPFDQARFDAGYYGGRARGGFGDEIKWDHPQQQIELQNKLSILMEEGDFNSILFIGCALGHEVRFCRNRGKKAFGVEISSYAVEHADPAIKEWVYLYNGWQLDRFENKSIGIVASFDVLTLVPHEMLLKLAPEMRRVCKNRIVIRTPIDLHQDQNEQWIGNDGVSFRCLTEPRWCQIFEGDGFKLKRSFRGESVPNEMFFIFSCV